MEFTADVFYEDGEDVVCIELKTVKPNKGIFKVEKQKILEAKAALKNIYPGKNIHFYLGFPFDPLNSTPTGFDKQRFMDYSVGFRKFFSENEFYLSSELWNLLSGETNTMESILEIINAIATVDFMKKFEFINKYQNAFSEREKYQEILSDWFLHSDMQTISKLEELVIKSDSDRGLKRVLKQEIFKISNSESSPITYNAERSRIISQFL